MNAKLVIIRVRVFAVATLSLAALRLSAATLVVDKADGPYRTIQAAVDAATAGDTVFIKNGVHDVGGKLDGFTTSMSNRVYVTKSLTLVGESKEGAIIKGAHATEGVDSVGLSCGANAVRCLGINADNVVVSNLTLTGGATHDTTAGNDSPENNGGGVYVVNGKKGIVLVDCIVSNNVARRAGALRYANDGADNHGNCLLVRTWVHGNKALDRDPDVRGCLAAFSLFTGHYSSSSPTYAATFVNCTFADGYCGSRGGSGAAVIGYNCLFAETWWKDSGSAKWYNCAFNKGSADTTSTTNEACVFNPGYDLFMAPPLVDYRLHNGATAVIGKGDASFLENIPEAYRSLDFYGHAVDTTSVSLGCAQEVVTPTGGTITFVGQGGMSSTGSDDRKSGFAPTTDNGFYFFNGVCLMSSKTLGYIRTMEGRTIVTVTHDPSGARLAAAQKGLHSFAASGSDTMRRFAQMDGSFVLMAPPAEKTLTLTPSFNATVLTVDRASTAETPDGTEDAPYARIQAAIDAVASGAFATIRVKAGIYDNDTGRLANNLTNRIFSNGRKVRLVSVDGRGKAVLPGAPDPSVALDAWPFGCGAGAMRCAFLQDGCAIQGFALTRGYSNTNADNTGRRGGALWLADGSSALDCVITNNVGWQGVAINGSESGTAPTAFALRCYIADNYPISTSEKTGGTSGIVRSTTVGSSIFYDNHGSNFGTYERQYTFQTTLADGAGADNGNLLNDARCVNTVVLAHTGKLNGPILLGGVYQTANGTILTTDSSSFVNADPLLADPAYGDFRLGATSPARTCGVTTHDDFTDSTKAAYYMFGATDFNGNVFRLFDGKPVCGAVDLYAPTVVLNGETKVLGVSSDRTFTWTSTSDDPHPWLGLEVTENGVVTTNATKSFTYTVADALDNPDAYELTIRDLYDSNWYVSDTDGADTNEGSSAAPKKTLKGALQYAVAGDTVHVAAGTYATETMTQTKRFGNYSDVKTDAYTHAARAVVPSGVSVIGAGADTTFIVGADDPNAADSDKGCGPAAVRCVALAKGARLSGFTLTGGRTDVGTADVNQDDDFNGGGVLAECSNTESELAVVTDCIISNCVAQRGGGGFYGVYNRVRFLDNSIIQRGNGPAARGNGGGTCRLVNCLVDRNQGWATVYDAAALNCTFGADNAQGSAKDGMSILVNAKDVRNCLILGTKTAGGTSLTFVNCVFSPQTEANLKKESDTKPTVDASCVATDELSVDANLALVIGANAAVDAADADGYDAAKWGDKDVYGNPRVMNGNRLDVGAVEADWRPAYTKKIGKRFVVTAVDPAVELVEDGVKIPAGASLAATVGRAGLANGAYSLKATVEDGATCAVTQDGDAMASLTAGANEVRYATGETGFSDFVFTADALGATVLSSLKANTGMLVILR